MNERISIKSVFPILGLALLLLISPCAVRNQIQSELGIPQTEVTNKSKTTVSDSQCNSSEIEATTFNKVKTSVLAVPGLFASNLVSGGQDFELEKTSHRSHSARSQSVSPVPLYILYQNLKVHL